MSIDLITGGYVWREGSGWSGMVWRGDVPCAIPRFDCLGRALNYVRENNQP